MATHDTDTSAVLSMHVAVKTPVSEGQRPIAPTRPPEGLNPPFEHVAKERGWATDDSPIRRQIRRAASDLPEDDVEIIENEVLTDLWQDWHTIEKLSPFIRKVVRNRVLDHRRRQLREDLATERDKHGNPVFGQERRIVYYDPTPGSADMAYVAGLASVPGPEQAVEDLQPDATDKLRRAMKRLPAGQRQVIDLALIQEYSTAEVALKLDVPEATVRKRLQRAREALQRDLGQWAQEYRLLYADAPEGARTAAAGGKWQGIDCRVGVADHASWLLEKRSTPEVLKGVTI